MGTILRMRNLLYTVWACLLPAVLVGCASQPAVTPQRLDQGLVLVLTGIEGFSPVNSAIRDGLAREVPYAIEVVDWTVGIPGLYLVNLRAEQRNRDQAEEIAQRIARYRQMHPGRPVVLVGHSGGAAMAVWIAEAMPAGQEVDGIICLASSLSPQYPLHEALDRSQRGIVNFYSPLDLLILGGGTTVFGTMDGQHTESAGRVGFEQDDLVGDGRPYARLYQVGWTERMLGAGNLGGHFSIGSSDFVARYVAPLVTNPHWSQTLIEDMTRPADPSNRPQLSRPPDRTVALRRNR